MLQTSCHLKQNAGVGIKENLAFVVFSDFSLMKEGDQDD